LGGIFFKEQAEALAKNGHQVSMIYTSSYSVLEIVKYKKIVLKSSNFTEKDVETYMVEYPYIPKLYTLKDKISLFFFKKKFTQYIAKNGLPDIVHLHSFVAGKFALWVKEKYDVPYVVTEHFSGFARGLVSKSNMQLANQVFTNSNANIAVSNDFTKLLKDKFNGEFQYIPNIVNIDFFNLAQKKNDKIFKFINVAFLDKNKNQNMLIKAFMKAFKNNDYITLTIVGDGMEYNELKELINKLQMKKQIFLYGRANRDEVKKLLQQSDAFVLSSQYETFGVVVVEAMACGLPVITTRCGGPESIVQNERVGVLCDIDEHSLAESMKYLYKNRDKYDNKFIAQYIKENFSEEAVCEQLTKVYERIINEY